MSAPSEQRVRGPAMIEFSQTTHTSDQSHPLQVIDVE